MSPEPPTIFIVDDDDAVRDSIEKLVRSAGYRFESFACGDDFLARETSPGPGCVLLDVRMPGLSGVDVQGRLVAAHSPLPVVFITGHADVPMAVAAMRRGAFDFIEKPFSPTALLEKIAAALAAWQLSIADIERSHDIQAHLARLTARETQVLERVVAGDPNKTIAAALGISQKTVETHRFRIMKKMEARNLPHLVQMVVFVRDHGPFATHGSKHEANPGRGDARA